MTASQKAGGYPAADSVCRVAVIETPKSEELRRGLHGKWLLAQSSMGAFP
jgi:hypothetical protein